MAYGTFPCSGLDRIWQVEGRKATQVNGISSSNHANVALKDSVPQGSIATWSHTRTYPERLTLGCTRIHADDNQLYLTFSPLIDLAQPVLENRSVMRSWMKKNPLKMNDEKTEVLIISSLTNRRKLNIDHLRVGESDISPATCIRARYWS